MRKGLGRSMIDQGHASRSRRCLISIIFPRGKPFETCLRSCQHSFCYRTWTCELLPHFPCFYRRMFLTKLLLIALVDDFDTPTSPFSGLFLPRVGYPLSFSLSLANKNLFLFRPSFLGALVAIRGTVARLRRQAALEEVALASMIFIRKPCYSVQE